MPTRIAVIDDDPSFLELMATFLGGEGYAVSTFGDGLNSFERVCALWPDCIVLDLLMTHMDDGWQLLQQFRAHPQLATTPIIVCSVDVHQLREQAASLYQQGCQVLPKPFDLRDLLRLLKQTTAGKR